MLVADVPAKVVSERLGHSSVTLMLDTYSHVLPTMQQRAADVMGRFLVEKARWARKAREWLQLRYKPSFGDSGENAVRHRFGVPSGP